MKTAILRWELWGILFITVLGAVLHFAFEWTGEWKPLGAIAAVNESVWEHFKIGFWPTVAYAIAEYGYFRRHTPNFFFTKAVGIYAIPVTIAVLFYGYTLTTGLESLVLDIIIFIIAVAVCQMVSYKLLIMPPHPSWLNALGVVLIIVLALAFIVFTYVPPHLPLFQDGVTGGYGIL